MVDDLKRAEDDLEIQIPQVTREAIAAYLIEQARWVHYRRYAAALSMVSNTYPVCVVCGREDVVTPRDTEPRCSRHDGKKPYL